MKQGWEYKKLGEVCCPKNKIQKATKCFEISDEILYIDISSIDNTIQKMTDVTSVTFGEAPSRAQQKVENGDIIISTVRPNLKNIAIIDRYESNLVASSGFCVLRSTELVERNYLFHYITSDLFTQHLMRLTTGANYPAVRDQDVRDSIIPLPPKSTQLSIVSELDKINELIRLKKEQLKDYDNLAQSIFYEMFGDPVENEKGWEVRLLKELCTKIGSGATPKGGNESYKQEGTALIRSLNVYNNEFRVKDLAFIDNAQAAALNNVTIEEQDVLLNITGASVARCCIVPTEILPARVNQHVCILRHGNNLYAIYLNRLFTNNSYQQLLQRLSKSKAATREALPKSIVDKLPIPLPPLPLQHLFAQRIEQIERQKSAVQKSITDLETLLASRMQYWFE